MKSKLLSIAKVLLFRRNGVCLPVSIIGFLISFVSIAQVKEFGELSSLNYQKAESSIQGNPASTIMQAITITGRIVSEEDGEGLPGVNVLIKGTSTGTVTDIDGNYSIDVPSQETILVFSSVGYNTVEVPVGS